MSKRFGVIWLHGLGDTGRGWSFLETQVGPSLTKAVGGQIAWSFPTAPTAPVAVNGGMEMTSWMNLDEIPVVRPIFRGTVHGPRSAEIDRART